MTKTWSVLSTVTMALKIMYGWHWSQIILDIMKCDCHKRRLFFWFALFALSGVKKSDEFPNTVLTRPHKEAFSVLWCSIIIMSYVLFSSKFDFACIGKANTLHRFLGVLLWLHCFSYYVERLARCVLFSLLRYMLNFVYTRTLDTCLFKDKIYKTEVIAARITEGTVLETVLIFLPYYL